MTDYTDCLFTLTASKKEEFNVDEWLALWENHPDKRYLEQFTKFRSQSPESKSHWLWFPETQETEKIFYFIPTNTE